MALSPWHGHPARVSDERGREYSRISCIQDFLRHYTVDMGGAPMPRGCKPRRKLVPAAHPLFSHAVGLELSSPADGDRPLSTRPILPVAVAFIVGIASIGCCPRPPAPGCCWADCCGSPPQFCCIVPGALRCAPRALWRFWEPPPPNSSRSISRGITSPCLPATKRAGDGQRACR